MPAARSPVARSLRARAVGWECPVTAWRCEAGAYANAAWPRGIAASTMAPILVHRLRARGIGGWHSLGVRFRGGEWFVEVRIWPPDEELVERLKDAAAPIPVYVDDREPAVHLDNPGVFEPR